MMNKENIRIMISGGGTGGHIFPAIAIAKALQLQLPDAEFFFVGARDKMEMEKIPEAGFPIEGLWISGFQRKLSLQNLLFPVKLVCSLVKARSIIKSFKPHVVIGVGGFASGPTLKMAASLGIPCLIQEQNSYPGITNKLLAKQVKKICVAYDGMEKFFPADKIVYTGNPIRKQVIKIDGKKSESIEFFKLDAAKKTILVVGGSLGAQSVNRSISKHIKSWSELEAQVIWQTGKTGYEEAIDLIEKSGVQNIHVYDFIKKMDLAYAACDLIISRAGAIAISEISAVGKAVIFVPYPYAAEDHQTKNAQQLVDKKAALLIKDSRVSEELFPLAEDLLKDEARLKSLEVEIKKLGVYNADDIIAQEVIKLIQ